MSNLLDSVSRRLGGRPWELGNAKGACESLYRTTKYPTDNQFDKVLHIGGERGGIADGTCFVRMQRGRNVGWGSM